MTEEIFLTCVIFNCDVTDRLKDEAECKENLDDDEIASLRQIVEKLKKFRHCNHTARLIEYFEENLPNLSVF